MPQPPAMATARPGPTAVPIAPASGKPSAWMVSRPAPLTAIIRANRACGVASRTRASSPSEYMLHIPDKISSGTHTATGGLSVKAR
jgi:hypothetical protein